MYKLGTMLLIGGKMEVAIMAGLFAKGNMEIKASHRVTLSTDKFFKPQRREDAKKYFE